MIKTILLDLDDTILDFHKAEHIALSATLREIGIEPTEAVLKRYSEINRAHWKRLELGELTRPEVLHGRFTQLFCELGVDGDCYEAQRIYEWKLGTGHYFLDGGQELLDTLYEKYDLYLASNGTDIVQTRRIASANIEHYFKDLFISQRLGFDKPMKEFFDRAFARIENFNPDETIIIGDSLTSDIKGGINAGIRTCWFNLHGIKNESGIIPDYEVTTLAQIPALLERI
jgi:2-haloacid dehalogenase